MADAQKILTDFRNLANDPNKVGVNLLKDDDVQIINIDGKDIIAIKVPRADYHLRPVYINDNPAKGSYRRNHKGDYHCAKEEIRHRIRRTHRTRRGGLRLQGLGQRRVWSISSSPAAANTMSSASALSSLQNHPKPNVKAWDKCKPT